MHTKNLFAGLVGLALALASGAARANGEKEPDVALVLGPREAAAVPLRSCLALTAGGNIRVTQTAPDTVVLTMTGAAATGFPVCLDSVASQVFELAQCFEVVFVNPKVQKAKLVLDAQVVGVLRTRGCCSHGGVAQISTPGHASIHCGTTEIAALNMTPRSVCGGENLSINDHAGPVYVPVVAGKYTFRQLFGITAAQGSYCLPCKAASADFSPGDTLKDEWVGQRQPFRGAEKKDFGFQVTLKVVAESNGGEGKVTSADQ